MCQEGINPVTVQSKNGRLNILKKATKSVKRPKRKLSTAPGLLLTSRTKGAKRAAADAEKNPAMQVPAKVDAKAAKRRKNRVDGVVSVGSPLALRTMVSPSSGAIVEAKVSGFVG